jgi:hypothetical protein
MSFRGAPPFDLVQLSSLPEETWLGRAVFHPLEQRGDDDGNVVAIWTLTDEDREIAAFFGDPVSEDAWDTEYDVGVVKEWEPDPDFADLGVVRVTFVMCAGHVLRYASTNLWTPRLRNDPR